ncbi:PREDICTED: neurensin-2 [Gavialis gangeticus]|uniref:neurensin-2 n=1 Tax=Gavialis gangeticus TaxID=94835 RepID=UPI00092F0F71|nr:PREDICTED: neurensin-2 [Gavialis gangeticus]
MLACAQPCSCSRGPSVQRGKWYGVRSYLHLFYEDCAGASLDNDADEPPAPRTRPAWPSVVWKVSLSAGALLLLLGAAALATGYLVPPKLEGIGEEEFLVLDLQAMEHNRALGTCRLAGVVLCTTAGVLVAAGLLACARGRVLWGGWRREEEEEEQLSPILRDGPPKQPGTVLASPASPFGASWVHGIQPRRET